MPFLDSYFDAPLIEDLPPVAATDLYMTPDNAPDDSNDLEDEDVFVFVAHLTPSGTESSTGPDPQGPTEPEYLSEMEFFDQPGRHSATKAMLIRFLIEG